MHVFPREMVASVLCPETVSRVSSVLNKDVKQFGKKYLFDGHEDTCWNSDQGSSQWILLEFPASVQISELHIQFQGGFSSRTCKLEGSRKNEDFETIVDFYPEDANTLQRFPVQATVLERLKITFQNSSDFFGRIIVYHLDVLELEAFVESRNEDTSQLRSILWLLELQFLTDVSGKLNGRLNTDLEVKGKTIAGVNAVNTLKLKLQNLPSVVQMLAENKGGVGHLNIENCTIS